MAVNEQQCHVDIAADLQETAWTLAHSTSDVLNPIDSYRLLVEFAPTMDDLQQTAR